MATVCDRYTELYNEKLQEAPCYKQPCMRTTVKVTGTITIVALLIIGSITAYALTHPLSSIGTIGHNLLGTPGLTATSIGSFTLSVASAVSLIIYIKKSHFALADVLQEDRGFLYKICDSEGEIRGYLYGTIDLKLPKHWKGLNDEVKAIIDECREVIVANAEETRNQCPKKSASYSVVDYVEQSVKPVTNLETEDVYRANYAYSIGFKFLRHCFFSCCCEKEDFKSAISSQEVKDRLKVTWQLGDAKGIDSMFIAQTNGKGIEIIHPAEQKYFKAFVSARTDDCLPKIKEKLAAEEIEPVFIAVDMMNLFDLDGIQIKGLLSHLLEDGWTISSIVDE